MISSRVVERIFADDTGQDLVEYTLLLVLLALAAVAAMEFLGGAVGSSMQNAGSEMQSAGG